MPNLPDPVLYAIPAFITLIVFELLYKRASRPVRYQTKDAIASITMGVGNMITGLLLATMVVTSALWAYQHHMLSIGYSWWAWILCFMLYDFLYYVFHRTAHRCRWFWASHVIHHSSQYYNLSTAVRQTWTGNLSLSFIFHMPLFNIGFPPAMVFFCGGLNLIYQFWIHTEAIDKCHKWFEAIFNTPSHHRVHHAINPRYLDSNYAGVFVIWDRLFGTFVAESTTDPCRYGLVQNLNSYNPLRIATHEWVAMGRDLLSCRSIRQMIGHIFGPPGWSLDGSRATSKIIKARWHAEQTRAAK